MVIARKIAATRAYCGYAWIIGERAPAGPVFRNSFYRTQTMHPKEITMTIELRSIGYVRSPYKKDGDAPRQGRLSDTVSEIVIDPEYRDGLFRLEKREHLFILCWFDKADRSTLRAIPPGSRIEQGVFAIRSPARPNPVSICVVDLLGVKDGVLRVRGLDAFDGTTVIDIKPYFEDIDVPDRSHPAGSSAGERHPETGKK